ncbi:MAG: DinB family protein [Fimbriimonadaceae bacterium]
MHPLAETVLICDRINRYLLEAIDNEGLHVKVEKSKTPAGHFCHIHSVRLMWIKAIVGTCELAKLEVKSSSRSEIAASLEESARVLADLVDQAITKGERIKGFKPSTEAFVGYLCAHDSFHRAQIELALRQSGKTLPDNIAYGMWEWGVR